MVTPNKIESLRDLVGRNLLGGTMVDYKDGEGFSREFARGTITEVSVTAGELFVRTLNPGCWMESNIDRMDPYCTFKEINGVVYIANVWSSSTSSARREHSTT